MMPTASMISWAAARSSPPAVKACHASLLPMAISIRAAQANSADMQACAIEKARVSSFMMAPSEFESRQLQPQRDGRQAGARNRRKADHQRRRRGQSGPAQHQVDHDAGDGRRRIDILAQDQRHLGRQQVAQHATAGAGQRAHQHDHRSVAAGVFGDARARHRKQRQAKGVGHLQGVGGDRSQLHPGQRQRRGGDDRKTGQASRIQKIGCRFSNRSRTVPPPTAVADASTRMPRTSSRAPMAASAPLMANTATGQVEDANEHRSELTRRLRTVRGDLRPFRSPLPGSGPGRDVCAAAPDHGRERPGHCDESGPQHVTGLNGHRPHGCPKSMGALQYIRPPGRCWSH